MLEEVDPEIAHLQGSNDLGALLADLFEDPLDKAPVLSHSAGPLLDHLPVTHDQEQHHLYHIILNIIVKSKIIGKHQTG